MGSVVSIARRLRAQRERNGQWRAVCPVCNHYGLSLGVGEVQDLVVHCHGGCDFDDIRRALLDYGLLDDDDADLPCEAPAVRPIIPDTVRIAGAVQLYTEARGGGSLVTNYVHECRGISLSPPAVLRENRWCPHRLGIRLPAMVALIVDIDGKPTGVHTTFLSQDGRRRANLPAEFHRETRGLVRGGVIRLAEHDPDSELVIGEGVETTLAAMQVFVLPGWSAVSAGNLKDRLELPETVRRILIAADNDIAGINAAYGARQRWTAQGRWVRVVMPSCADTDFNDVLLRGTR